MSLALPEFQLVSFGQCGYPQLLPPRLGCLPLYPDDDGFFSVNGSLGLTICSPRTPPAPTNHGNYDTIRAAITDLPGSSSESLHIAPDRLQCCLNDDNIGRFATHPLSHDRLLCLPNYSVVSHRHVLRRGVTSAASQDAPGNLRS